MKKGIYIRFLIIIFITAVLSGTISAFFAATKEEAKIKETAIQICRTISELYSSHPEAVYWSGVLDGVRITIIDSDGTVLDDSHTDASEMENHLGRNEVIYARKGYIATDTRSSGTLGRPFMYAATTMPDGSILRIAISYGGIVSGLRAELPVLVISFFVTAIIVTFIARSFTNRVTQPLEDFTEQILSGNFEVISNNKSYCEIDRITAKIQILLQEIEKSREETQLQNDKIHYILSNIKEGFVWLDYKANIVLINKSALNIFHLEMPISETNFIEFTRDKKLIEAVQKAISEEQDSLLEWEVEESVFSAHISPVKGEYVGSEKNGATVLLVDVGAERVSQKQRSEFFANASHELKTPITTLMGFSEMLKDGTLPELKRQPIYQRIHTETQRMNTLIGDILTISRLESGMTEDLLERINIATIAKDVVAAYAPQAHEREVTLSHSLKDVYIKANTRRIWDLLSNLVDNAIKYNKRGGSVTIEVAAEQDYAAIGIIDTGIGIKKSDYSRVFERFYRSETNGTKIIKGTGLGLAIVKHIVNSYGGNISLNSNLGSGTEIKIKFPVDEEA